MLFLIQNGIEDKKKKNGKKKRNGIKRVRGELISRPLNWYCGTKVFESSKGSSVPENVEQA